MAKWRPEGWENPFMYYEGLYSSKSLEIESNEHYSIYEAGADAMLEALMRWGEAKTRQGIRGYSVFIPDDENIP